MRTSALIKSLLIPFAAVVIAKVCGGDLAAQSVSSSSIANQPLPRIGGLLARISRNTGPISLRFGLRGGEVRIRTLGTA